MDVAEVLNALEIARSEVGQGRDGAQAVEVLERAATFVARHLGDREEIVEVFGDSPNIWSRLESVWEAISDAFDPAHGRCEPIGIAAAVAKLERNLIAGLHEFQQEALPHEPLIRRTIFSVTTFSRIEETTYHNLQAVLAQLLCNLVSPTDDEQAQAQADRTLQLYLSGNREDDVVVRLLDSKDARTNTATLHIINNLTLVPRRLHALLSPVGVRWLAQLLGRLEALHDTHDGRFEVAVTILQRFITHDLHGELYELLGVEGETVTPSQVTLLKLVDSSLATERSSNPNSSPYAFLLPAWHLQAQYCAASMRSGKDDTRLPSVVAALMLATESLSAIVLAAQARIDAAKAAAKRGQALPLEEGGDEDMVKVMKGRIPGQAGVVKQLVDTLAASNEFLPRIKPGEAKIEEIDEEGDDPQTAFKNVKRDLVRLLGVLSFDDVEFGNDVREAGGVAIVLGLCETDERNTYLREHALFAVRNLMTNNPANQAIIAEMDPVGIVGDDGELKPLPENLKKSHERSKAAGAA